jgi:cyclophilin family peptidyl-prolyl cis-trans isomerase
MEEYMFIRFFSLVLILGLISACKTDNTSAQANPKILMKTSKGDITIEFDQKKAPITVKNFLAYVDEEQYDGTIFHRVIEGFMIQGGGYDADFHQKATKPPIENEAINGLKNKRGTIAMGRLPEIHSASKQFYINHVDNPGLNHKNNTPAGFGYCVFGKVIKGMDVVDAIANTPTTEKQGFQDAPRETVTIISVRRI